MDCPEVGPSAPPEPGTLGDCLQAKADILSQGEHTGTPGTYNEATGEFEPSGNTEWPGADSNGTGLFEDGPGMLTQEQKDAGLLPDDTLWKQDGGAVDENGQIESGFDCDDFADAFGNFMNNTQGDPGSPCSDFTVSKLNVAYTNSDGARIGHEINKITDSDGNYFLADAASGTTAGPFSPDEKPDASTVMPTAQHPKKQEHLSEDGAYVEETESLYDTENGDCSSITTFEDELELNERSSLEGGEGETFDPNSPLSPEPPPWHESPAMVSHFESMTGYAAGDFSPAPGGE